MQTRKTLQLIASIGPAACLLYLAAAANHDAPPLDVTGAVALLVATLSLAGFTAAGFASNHQDLTVRYTGILFGITVRTLLGYCTPCCLSCICIDVCILAVSARTLASPAETWDPCTHSSMHSQLACLVTRVLYLAPNG